VNTKTDPQPPVPGEPCKLITAVIPDDGTDVALMSALRAHAGVIRAASTACLGSSITADARTRRGRLPEPILARKVEILAPADRADELFEFVCEHAGLTDIGRGTVFQTAAPYGTAHELPDIPDEQS
jgi:hypothetical protein